MVQKRTPVSVELKARQAVQGASLVGRNFTAAKQVYCRTGRAGLGSAGGHVGIAHGADFALQRHQVGGWLGVENHQVAGNATPRPKSKGLNQGAQETETLLPCGKDQHNRAVARNSESP